ncbi:MAG: hypothetical protein QOF28_2056, partial [Actinomycetota bacterium]|nr:hypothetical protein [Actinomycetota bacterium]
MKDASASLVEDLTSNLPVGVVLAECRPYRVLWASRATAAIMELPYDEICRGPAAWLPRIEADGAERVKRYIDLVEREPVILDMQYVIRPLEGDPHLVHVRSEPLFAADGTYARRLAIIDAVEVSTERTREHVDKVAFLAELSHEMRTPLSSMLGFAELLADSTLDDRQARWATLLQESGRHLVELLETALSLARLEDPSGALPRVRVSLGPVIRRCLDLLEPIATARRIALITDERNRTPVVALGDPERLQQVLLNVLTNALKFGPPRSAVVVSTSVQGTAVSVEVRDAGPGIETAQRERIFEPFERL